jgi:hypothetical protein
MVALIAQRTLLSEIRSTFPPENLTRPPRSQRNPM